MNGKLGKRRPISLLVAASVWATGVSLALPSFADEGLGGFSNIAESETADVAAERWGPVPTDKLSLVNVAPVLLPYFNNAPVFGVPGTVVGNFWERTQVTGDWGGLRTELARRGLFIDVYTTGAYQNVTSGGIETGDAAWLNTQISVNVDTGRAGLWSGGLLHATAQGRWGAPPDDTFTLGTSVPQYYGLLWPGPELSHDIYFTDFYLVQALTKKFAVILGTINGLNLPDQTLFGDSYRYNFTNFAFNLNPMFANFYGPTALAALGIWAPTSQLVIQGGVLDPNTTADNFGENVFDDVNLYTQATYSYSLRGLPGQVSVAFNWSDQPQPNLEAPFGSLLLGETPEALRATFQSGAPLPTNPERESWFAIANFSQYLYVLDDPATIPTKLKSGQQLRGIGFFGRLGYAPEKTNPVARHASIALLGSGLSDSRPIDSYGAGIYYNGVSDDLKNTVGGLTRGAIDLKDEVGFETFYDFAVTPAVRFVASYQHIWNPLIAQLKTREDHADAVFARVNVQW